MYGVPRATLHDRVTGRVKPDACSGPAKYLSVLEEEELINFLYGCAHIGYPRTRHQVLAIVQRYLSKKGSTKIVSNGWWQRFRERHRTLSLRNAAPLSQPRAQAMGRVTLDRYYDILENTLIENELFKKPKQIFNCDETGMPLSPKAPKTICRKGEKNPSCISGDTKAQVSVLACVNAAGQWIPPFVIFDRKRLKPELTTGEVPNTYYGLSWKGWMDADLFSDWFMNHFLSYAPSDRPLLLLMDGCSSHFSPQMMREAAKEQVILFILPPHSTQVCQPLDKGVFSALKSNWREVCHEFITNNPGRVVTRNDFSSLFCQAWDMSMTIRNIKAGFKVTGVYPFNRSAITLPEDGFEKFKPEALSSDNGINYIPFYTCSPLHPRKDTKSSQESINSELDPTDSEPDESDNDSFFHTTLPSAQSTPLRTKGANPTLAKFSQTPAKPLPYVSKFTQLLQLPRPPSKIPTKRAKSSGRVLTSEECLAAMEEKEKQKQEAAMLKEQRKLQRELKKKLKSDAVKSSKASKSKAKGSTVCNTSESCHQVHVRSVTSSKGRCDTVSMLSMDSLSDASLDSTPELCSWNNDLGLSKADERALIDGKWLTANHMSAAHMLLKKKYPHQNGLQDTCALLEESRWCSVADAFVQIIFVHPNHWACLSNKFCDKGTVDLYDSLHTIPSEEGSIVVQACTIMKSRQQKLKINVVNVQHQSNSDDCGLHAIAIARDLCAGIDPVRREYSQAKMRGHLKLCFENKRQTLNAFPSRYRAVARRYIHQCTVDLFCVCRQPELSKTMACCDNCDIWYHKGCVPIPAEVLSDNDDLVHWVCCQCAGCCVNEMHQICVFMGDNPANSYSSASPSGQMSTPESTVCDATSKGRRDKVSTTTSARITRSKVKKTTSPGVTPSKASTLKKPPINISTIKGSHDKVSRVKKHVHVASGRVTRSKASSVVMKL